jgi:hypothetical protein
MNAAPRIFYSGTSRARARVNCSVFALTVLGPKEAEMVIIGCDLHARQQTLAMLDTTAGEVVEVTLKHGGFTCCPNAGSEQNGSDSFGGWRLRRSVFRSKTETYLRFGRRWCHFRFCSTGPQSIQGACTNIHSERSPDKFFLARFGSAISYRQSTRLHASNDPSFRS